MSRKRGAWEWLWWITDGHPDLWHSEAVLAAWEGRRTELGECVWRGVQNVPAEAGDWHVFAARVRQRYQDFDEMTGRFSSDPEWIRYSRVYSGGDNIAAAQGVVPWLFFLGAYVGIRRLFRMTKIVRLRSAVMRERCPECGYDLSHGADIVMERTRGIVRIGPRLCPECGLLWPLLPPDTTGAELGQPSQATRAG